MAKAKQDDDIEMEKTLVKNEASSLLQRSGDNNGDGDDRPLTDNATKEEFQLYPKRWFILASFCLLNLSNGWIWVTWSPLTALVAHFWGVSEGQVDALSGVYVSTSTTTSAGYSSSLS
jgi:FLVCR family MFS transporter 7